MSVLDDFVKIVQDYPKTNVVLSIVERTAVAPPNGTAVNTDDTWSFRVRIENKGHLNMTGVLLHIAGLNGALVSRSETGAWLNTIVVGGPSVGLVGGLTINCHDDPVETQKLYFKAPSAVKPAGTALVRVHIGAFDANLNDILRHHTGHSDPPSATYSDQVFPR